MNNKIKATEVSCLIDGIGDYDQVYNSLMASFPKDEEMIFAERTPGHEFLQWNLPGNDWITLEDGDPIQTIDVKKELERRMQAIRAKFGNNQAVAEKLLSYPDDSYVFYKFEPSGKLLILITAWGYRHPVKIEGSGAGGILPLQEAKEHTTLHLAYAGKPLANHDFVLNKMSRMTDGNGTYPIGDLPVGYEFEIELNGRKHKITIAEGKGDITIDATIYTEWKVKAILDGKPYASAPVKVCYCGQQYDSFTDSQGFASGQVALSTDAQPCTVTVGSESQNKPLSETPTLFSFDFKTEVPVDAEWRVRATLNGSPYASAPVKVCYCGQQYDSFTDSQGFASGHVALSTDAQPCTVTVGSESQDKPLSETPTLFSFDFKAEVPVDAEWRVKAILDGKPYASAPVKVSYCGQQYDSFTDSQGFASGQVALSTDAQPCTVTVGSESQNKPLSETPTLFSFDFKTEVPVVAEWKVRATLDGKPYASAPVKVCYCGQQYDSFTDSQGFASGHVALSADAQPCTVTVGSESQDKPLSETPTLFSFDFNSTEEQPSNKVGCLPMALFGIGLAILVYATYEIGLYLLGIG